jgi:hypothetical protein
VAVIPNGVPPAATGPLVTPFPEVGPLMRLAYRELSLAAHGSEAQARALGDPKRLPRPWDPATCDQADLRGEVWAWLDAVVEWLNREYVWDATAMIPACRPAHAHLVHEIGVVADQRRRAGVAFTSDALEDWHRYTLPGFLDRMRARLRGHCDEGHQPWPAKGRHARHTDQAARADRAQSFGRDADYAESAAARAPRKLSVVDLDTGEVREEPGDW